MEEKYRRIRKVSSFLSQLHRIANSKNTLRLSEIRRSSLFVVSADATRWSCLHIRNSEGQFILPSYIIQRVGFGEPDVTMIEV